jgi:DNA-directed RNA polymerase specialized sigma24 family protein
MMAGSDCGCLICRLEASLLDELHHEKSLEEYRLWAASSRVLAAFPTPAELVAHLHRHHSDEGSSSADEILAEFVGTGRNGPFGSMRQRILLLVFVPTIHRTTSQIGAAFPALAREDTAQHLFAILLEFLDSQELRARRSHLAFTIARKMRRSAFRWAIRESRIKLANQPDLSGALPDETATGGEASRAAVLLSDFLDKCQQRGWLTVEERQLLIRFKLEGLTGAELSRASGRSALAIRHRVHRLLERLRRIAQKPGAGIPEQLDLFRP